MEASHGGGQGPEAAVASYMDGHSEVTVDVDTVGQSVRWTKEAEAGRGEIHGKPPEVPDSICWVDEQIRGNRHVTKDAFCSALSISKGSVMAVTEKHDCSRVYTRFAAMNADRYTHRGNENRCIDLVC